MEFEPVIGLEIHVELKTKSKMFSASPVTYGKDANSQTTPLDFGFPGTMPIINKQAVKYAIRVCNALHMSIDHELHFDRKNYFYSDLPKGYQITQDRRPIGSNGYLEIDINGEKKKIGIERLHMEEDTCKQIHFKDFTLLNYNRAGTPLIEIVSKPELKSGEEAMKYVEMIRSIVVFSDVSDGRMEEGSLRCDVNVSIRPKGTEKFGTKVEVKNINSISYVRNAIDFEVERQKKVIESGGAVVQETRRYDDTTGTTIAMRLKTDSVDYKYFPEPNIIPIKLSDKFVNDAIESCPELAESKKRRYLDDYKLSEYDSSLLVSNKEVSCFYDECTKLCKEYKALANWINVDVLSYLNKNNISINDFPMSPKNLVSLVEINAKKEVSSNQAKAIFAKMLEEKCDCKKAQQILGISAQISDESFIQDVINQVLYENPQSIIDYKDGKDRALGFMVGQVMKKTQGKVNPQMTSEMLLKEIAKR